ncbi:MAG: hypothetical protein WAU65_03270 [Candidatus Nanoarchaeia archaeon]
MKNKKKFKIILGIIFGLIAFIILATSLILADNELTVFSGGDNQTAIGIFGDAQLYSTGLSAPMQTYQSSNQSNQSNQTIIIVNNVGSGGGGGTTTVTVPTNVPIPFTLSTNNIKTDIKQGQVSSENVTVTNIGQQVINVSITNQIGNLVRLSDNYISLNPGQSQVVTIDFIASPDTTPNLYIGSIIFQSGNSSQQLSAAIEVDSANPLLDVAINLPSQYNKVSPGDTILAGITLYNLGSSYGDVSMEYFIETQNGTIISNQTDTVAIQTQASFIKSLQIPNNAPLGNYFLYVRATYNGKLASASTGFQIVSTSQNEKVYIIIIIILGILAIGTIIFILAYRMKKHYKKVKRVGMEDLLFR